MSRCGPTVLKRKMKLLLVRPFYIILYVSAFLSGCWFLHPSLYVSFFISQSSISQSIPSSTHRVCTLLYILYVLIIVSMRERIPARLCGCVRAHLSNIQHRWDTGEGGRFGGGNQHTNKRKHPPRPSTHPSIYSSDQQSTHLAVFKYLQVLKEIV